MSRFVVALASLAVVVGCFSETARAEMSTMSVDGTIQAWQDSGLYVTVGQVLEVTATGQVWYNFDYSWAWTSPDGIGPEISNPGPSSSDAFLPSAIGYALIAKIGDSPVPEGATGMGPGFVGSHYHQTMLTSGELFFAYNDTNGCYGDNAGAFALSATTVPEPSTIAFLGIGATSLLAYAWRKRRTA
jgi:hypothetical protein